MLEELVTLLDADDAGIFPITSLGIINPGNAR